MAICRNPQTQGNDRARWPRQSLAGPVVARLGELSYTLRRFEGRQQSYHSLLGVRTLQDNFETVLVSGANTWTKRLTQLALYRDRSAPDDRQHLPRSIHFFDLLLFGRGQDQEDQRKFRAVPPVLVWLASSMELVQEVQASISRTGKCQLVDCYQVSERSLSGLYNGQISELDHLDTWGRVYHKRRQESQSQSIGLYVCRNPRVLLVWQHESVSEPNNILSALWGNRTTTGRILHAELVCDWDKLLATTYRVLPSAYFSIWGLIINTIFLDNFNFKSRLHWPYGVRANSRLSDISLSTYTGGRSDVVEPRKSMYSRASLGLEITIAVVGPILIWSAVC